VRYRLAVAARLLVSSAGTARFVEPQFQLSGGKMKKEYSKPGLKALGLLRVITKFSGNQLPPPPPPYGEY
jgi:hypothetical protein